VPETEDPGIGMNDEQIRSLVRQLDTRDATAQDIIWTQLRPLGEKVVDYLAEFYPKAGTLEGRRALLFHSIKYARSSEVAFRLGVTALGDKASIVRYRACGLLAYSLRREALPHLQTLLSHKDRKTVEDAQAAMDAIQSKNHHYFVDRNHSGRLFWQVGDEEAEAAPPGDQADPP
jgi:HEAT repeat protein